MGSWFFISLLYYFLSALAHLSQNQLRLKSNYHTLKTIFKVPALKNTEYFDEAEIKFNPRLKQVIFSFLSFQHEADGFDLTFAPHLISLVWRVHLRPCSEFINLVFFLLYMTTFLSVYKWTKYIRTTIVMGGRHRQKYRHN